ncbi:glyceraldehyde-3-phosphate dehydrogenase [Trypanosoma theileri]|uniref:Glyceraldehyde-3-phosphate dehydrogenase n=1 Tax=Trypanosoma theileri TaxID=67003 RepID=A0A1X0P6C0_9TRYP|nr:glyceraldehyde-3-phosphate dehydrogenase [Trypanosoma theileri]ORC91980.1 glyceraldehyde-3-phosphate dehydrogenase [Trypanosoma theileri]
MADVTMPIGVGINGFGDIGQSVLFSSFTDPLVNVVAINDASMNIEYMAYLLRHESPLSVEEKSSVVVVGEYICIHGNRKIRVTQKHDLAEIGWHDAGVIYVLECTGLNSTQERCWGHITGGAHGVIIAGQSADAPTVVLGVNEMNMKKTHPVVCAGSPIAVALAPLIRILHEQYMIDECSYTALHGIQKGDSVMGKSKNPQEWRQKRSALDAIIPCTQTGKKTMEKIMPTLAEYISGSAFQVPVVKGCAIDMIVRFAQPVSKEVLDTTLKEAASGRLSEALLYSEEDLINRDCLPNGKLYYDAISSQCLRDGSAHKLLLWFDIEGSYAKRILSLVPFLQKLGVNNEM